MHPTQTERRYLGQNPQSRIASMILCCACLVLLGLIAGVFADITDTRPELGTAACQAQMKDYADLPGNRKRIKKGVGQYNPIYQEMVDLCK